MFYPKVQSCPFWHRSFPHTEICYSSTKSVQLKSSIPFLHSLQDDSHKVLRCWRLKFEVIHEVVLAKFLSWVQGSPFMIYNSHGFKRKSQSQRKSGKILLTSTCFSNSFWPVFGGRDPIKVIQKSTSLQGQVRDRDLKRLWNLQPQSSPKIPLSKPSPWAGAWTSPGSSQSEQLHKYGKWDLLSGWKSLLAC